MLIVFDQFFIQNLQIDLAGYPCFLDSKLCSVIWSPVLRPPQKAAQTMTLLSLPVLYVVTMSGFHLLARGPNTHSFRCPSLAQPNIHHHNTTSYFPPDHSVNDATYNLVKKKKKKKRIESVNTYLSHPKFGRESWKD